MSVISWNTQKSTNGFDFRVYSLGYQEPQVTLKSGHAATRAIATRLAKQWTLALKMAAKI